MPDVSLPLTDDARVAFARLDAYPARDTPDDSAARALARAADALGWSAAGAGAFGAVVPPGARVLVKPNLVLHENHGPWGMDPLVTHPSLVRATVEALLAGPVGSVVVGDAPVQGCDFARLMAWSGLPAWADTLASRDARMLGVRDFRRTKSVVEPGGARVAERDTRSLDHFVLFDLGRDSLLEPITDDTGAFRVTMYPPELMRRTHAPGRHQYLVAREVIEADVVVNMPKLKTHKKAGITCALKNLIGINGNKEFLPHHRVGGAASGGDCYPGASPVKRALEYALDRQNSTDDATTQRAIGYATRVLYKAASMLGDELGVEGSWSGNDTIWRTCLDLNRILLYGRLDGSLADTPQRQVLNVVDAVVGGHGDGPLAPQPLPLGMVLTGASSAAVDWVGAHLLGYDPVRIPISREAFGRFRWPLASFDAAAVRIVGDLGPRAAERADLSLPPDMAYPVGWLPAVAEPAGARAVAAAADGAA